MPRPRTCYVCGQPAERRLIVEPLLLPVCHDRACAERARSLPERHCAARLLSGEVCGKPATPIHVDGDLQCQKHAAASFGHQWRRAA